MLISHNDIWKVFCDSLNILNASVPLFETDDNQIVQTKLIGKNNRPILCRSRKMEQLILEQTDC